MIQRHSMLENQKKQYTRYNSSVLLTLFGFYIISLALLIIPFVLIFNLNDTPSGHSFLLHSESWLGPSSGIGLLLLLGEAIALLIIDWHGAVTLRGAVQSQTMYKGKMVDTAVGYALLYIFFSEIMLPIYLLRATFDHFQTKQLRTQQQKHEQKFEIANLEAKMGMLPFTDGTCRACKKPLVIGAEFCQYCGTTVVEKAKVCPSCSTSALPDAKWCPKCRTALS